MFFTELLPVELWMIIFKMEHSMFQANVIEEVKQLSQQIEELNRNIDDEKEKWNLLKWNSFKIEFNKKDFIGRCQQQSFKYFEIPKNHTCYLCSNN